MRAVSRYHPIEDYALLGDCHGAALVSRAGSVDWCCFDRFDAEPQLWPLLDAGRGGCFSIAPVAPAQTERAYLPETFVLRTVHRGSGGGVAVTDFMPACAHPHKPGGVQPAHPDSSMLVRVVEGLAGQLELRVRFEPPTLRFAPADAGLAARPAALLLSDEAPGQPLPRHDAVLRVAAGERRVFVLAPADAAALQPAQHAQRLLAETQQFWEAWCARCAYTGDYADAVRRSALTLKALTFAPTGAIVAAPSTSLPEELGGVRNWDYRFTWLRDASMVLQAFAALGYTAEARQFCGYLDRCCANSPVRLQVLYGIGTETSVPERCLDQLEGYQGSRPVRVGNAAVEQVQIDVYGELADWALVYQKLGGEVDARLERIVRNVADYAAQHWAEPDQGIWELRRPPRQHVHSKAFAWVALDRSLKLLGPHGAWEQARAGVLQELLQHGVDPTGSHLVQAYGEQELDAALLTLPLLDLPLSPPLLERTVEAVRARLQSGEYVHRYLNADGLPGGEGAFLICSFWLVDALLFTGRAEQARALFERLLLLANDVGLYPEEVQPGSGAFLGNFPQAFTHLALVNSAVHLELHKQGGDAALQGTQADRAARAVRLTGAPALHEA
jgi:GH15 family glucan-1,4-alpha-glucosidase